MSAYKTNIETQALGSVIIGTVEVNVAHTGDKWRGDLHGAMAALERDLKARVAHGRLVQGMDKEGE